MSDAVELTNDDTSERSSEGPGQALKDAREAIGVTQREVADALNLNVAIVVALEEDDLQQLPDPVFTKGYVRSYARLLDLDPDPLVTAVGGFGAAAENGAATKPLAFVPAKLLLIGGGVAVALVALIVVVATLLSSAAEDSASDGAIGSALGGEEQPNADATLAALPQSLEPTSEAPLEPLRDEVLDTVTPVVADQAPSDPEPSAGFAPAAAELDTLVVQLNDDCWVEVKTDAGDVLYMEMALSGQRLELSGSAPFHILLGYAPGASVTFNGEPMALAPFTTDNIARLVVGQ